ncbi:MAG: deoxycytidine triphosphate deaminase, partial [Candidatus Saccharimonadales bacterium]
MSVFSNTQIRQAIADDHIVCHPFNDTHVSHASLDVTLGYYFYRIEPANERTIYNPFDKEDVERYFDGPYKAMPHGEWAALNGFKPIAGIPLDHPVIALKPG